MRGVLAAALLALALVACGDEEDKPKITTKVPGDCFSTDLCEHLVTLSDGQELRCVSWRDEFGGGLSCDWESLAASKATG